MKCYVHSNDEAIGMCVSCGKPICEECKVEIEDKFYCKSCLKNPIKQQDIPSEQIAIDKKPATKSNAMGCLVVIISLLIISIGIVALTSLFSKKDSPEMNNSNLTDVELNYINVMEPFLSNIGNDMLSISSYFTESSEDMTLLFDETWKTKFFSLTKDFRADCDNIINYDSSNVPSKFRLVHADYKKYFSRLKYTLDLFDEAIEDVDSEKFEKANENFGIVNKGLSETNDNLTNLLSSY